MAARNLDIDRLEESMPVATYTCQGCNFAEETDLCYNPVAEQWVCESCYEDMVEDEGGEAPQELPLYISDLPRLRAEASAAGRA